MAQVGNGIRAHSAPEAEVHLVIGIWYLVPLMCCSHCTSFSANLSCVRWKPEGANDGRQRQLLCAQRLTRVVHSSVTLPSTFLHSR